jgi:hypothetical protein
MEFLIENLGIDNSDTFPGYGLGPNSHYDGCVYGIGDTEKDALDDAIFMLAQSIDLTDEFECSLNEETHGMDFGETTVAEELGLSEEEQEEINDSGIGTYFHVGIKWRA